MKLLFLFAASLWMFCALPASAAPALSQEDFNRLAARQGLPLLWSSAGSATATLRPGDLSPVGEADALSLYVRDGRFTEEFDRAYLSLVGARRLEAVRKELDQGRPALIVSDFRSAPEADRKLARGMQAVGRTIEELYAMQKGSFLLRKDLTAADPESRALFERNHGPWCEAPDTEHDPFCNALPSFPARISDAYPADMKQDDALCEALKTHPDSKSLLDPFTVVRRKEGRFAALSLTEAYGEKMRAAARELRAAAQSQGPEEEALKAYLLAAARGFETNDWSAADEAWSRMNGRNSRWYLRAAPDEVYFDPCQEKAGFALAFARIDKASLAWQDRLSPLRQEMEDAVAALIGPAYKARKALFGLPDFIEIVLNSGDSRHPLGGVAGQSLPNWGKVAQESRRRTMVMTNLGDDPESRRIRREKGAQMVDASTLANLSDEREPDLLQVLLHEAAHNLGPHSDSLVDGKSPSELFGGRLETVLEELKAETLSLWYADFLVRKGLLTQAREREIYTYGVLWCFGHIQQGMFSATGSPKPYSQLAAVQIGSFMEAGALVWKPGPDGVERFGIVYERMPAAVEDLARKIGRIKASGDVSGAKELIDRYVSGPGAAAVHMREIVERLSRFPKNTYSYTLLY
ncbi:MAG: hypothetical protein WCU88_13215 [Elusimicrobiota bacterium]|jgi:hypothetical protein